MNNKHTDYRRRWDRGEDRAPNRKPYSLRSFVLPYDEPRSRARLLWLGLAAFTAGLAVHTVLHILRAEPELAPAAVASVAPPAPAVPRIAATDILQHAAPGRLALQSEVALVMDDSEGVILYQKNADLQRPIASLTKLVTAMVVLDAGLPADELITITEADRDRWRGSRSRFPIGSTWTRGELLTAALSASDNRAALALARTYPGGTAAFMQAMNAKAAALGMTHTHFSDAAGLQNSDASTAQDLARLARAADHYPVIREITATGAWRMIEQRSGRPFDIFNTNRLVRNPAWNVSLSKTGYTSDAGNCLLMRVTVGDRPVVIVLLNSWGALSKYGDSARIRDWLLRAERRISALNTAPTPQTTAPKVAENRNI